MLSNLMLIITLEYLRSLGANLSIAYNGATFITDAGGTEPAENAFNSEMDSSSGVAILPVNDD